MKNKSLMITVALIAVLGITAFVYYGNNEKTFPGNAEKAYIAVEGSGEIAVLDTRNSKVLKKIDLSEEKNGKVKSYMPHNVEVAPDNKSVWVTANAIEKKEEEMGMSFRIVPLAYADEESMEKGVDATKSSDEVIIIDPLTDTIIKRIEIGKDLHLAHVSLTQDNSYAIVAS